MILNESKTRTVTVHRDNWRENGNAISFDIERKDGGVLLSKPINIGKSLVKIVSKNGSYTTFEIPEWVLKKSLGTSFRIFEG